MSDHVHLAIPCYGGQVTAQCMRSVLELQVALRTRGIRLTIDLLINESLVQRARNRLAANFLRNRAATHLLFIDADIQFRAADILAMLACDKPLVCAAYPVKNLDVAKLREHINEPDPLAMATRFAVNALCGPDGSVTVDGPLVPIAEAATGCLLLKRHVLEEMVDALPETAHYSDAPASRGEPLWSLFDCFIHEGRYLSEDYVFSRRWRAMGGTIWMYWPAVLWHVGQMVYRGNLGTMFQVNAG